MGSTEIVLTYKIGDSVIYKHNGIFRVADVKMMNFMGGEKLYYILESIYSKGSNTYVPTDLEGLQLCMRPLLTKNEILDAIQQAQHVELQWDDDTKQRYAVLSEVVSTLDRVKILAVYFRIHQHKTQLEAKRKKLYASDLRLYLQSEKMIRDEFAFVLDMPREEVIPYIFRCISQ